MISVLLDFITSPAKNLSACLIGAVIGQITIASTTSIIASYIAILAGVMTVINLFFPLRSFYENYKRKNCKKL